MLEEEKKYIREAQDGNQESFGIIYDHYVPQIYRFVFFKVSVRQVAEDLTHEIFLSAWQNIKNYKQKQYPISSWIYQIARNKVIDHYRTDKKNISKEASELRRCAEEKSVRVPGNMEAMSSEEVRRTLADLYDYQKLSQWLGKTGMTMDNEHGISSFQVHFGYWVFK